MLNRKQNETKNQIQKKIVGKKGNYEEFIRRYALTHTHTHNYKNMSI